MVARKKYKIMYPKDYHEPEKAGKPYLPKGKMVVMSGGGVFYAVYTEPYSCGIVKLSTVLPKYDVVWK